MILDGKWHHDYDITMNDSNSPVILIVEDDKVLLNALKTTFEKENYKVLVGMDGEEGLSLALTEHPNIILLDIVMPKMSGTEMLTKLRQDKWGSKVPVIMLTAASPDSTSQLSKFISTQPSYYLIKSNTKIDEVEQKVKELLNKEE